MEHLVIFCAKKETPKSGVSLVHGGYSPNSYIEIPNMSKNIESIAYYPRAIFQTLIEACDKDYESIKVYCPLSSGCLPNNNSLKNDPSLEEESIAHYPRAVFLTILMPYSPLG